MQAVLLFVLAGLIGGIAVGLQSPLASLIGQKLGLMESVFILHFGGALLSGLLLLFAGGGTLGQWRTVPWYALIAGTFGLVIIAAVNYTIPQLGTTTTIALVVCGQFLIGLVIDHFGLLGVAVRPIDVTRLLGIGVIFVGIYLIMR